MSAHSGSTRFYWHPVGGSALSAKKRGRKAKKKETKSRREKELERETRRLRRRLEKVELMLEIQKKTSELLGIPLNSDESNENV